MFFEEYKVSVRFFEERILTNILLEFGRKPMEGVISSEEFPCLRMNLKVPWGCFFARNQKNMLNP